MKLIIILGYTLNGDGSIQPILQSRLDEAISFYGPTDEFLVCGKRPPKALAPMRCETTTEAEAMKKYLIANGIPAEKIFKEEQSTTTFGNAYYSYWSFLKNTTKYQSIFVISNKFHYPLVKYSFDKIFGDKYPYAFHPVSDVHLKMNHQEIKQWESLIQKVVDTCYPLLFGDVQNGDIDTIKSIIEGPRHLGFETSIKNSLQLDDSVDIGDFISGTEVSSSPDSLRTPLRNSAK